MMNFIDLHRDIHGVEPVCTVLQSAPSGHQRRAARFELPTSDAPVPNVTKRWYLKSSEFGTQICRSTAPTKSGIN